MLALFIAGTEGFAQEASLPTEKPATSEVSRVEIKGDKVEVVIPENKVVAEGHVVVTRDEIQLFCDRLEFHRDDQTAIARGNVVLVRDGTRLEGDHLKFDFETKQGEFVDAEFSGRPFRGAGRKVEKVGENHIVVEQGYLSTCDLDHPHYRFSAKKVDLYPGEKAVARGTKLQVGSVPLLYFPRFSQDLRDKRAVFSVTPGYQKEWGAFLLSQYRMPLNDYIRMTLHLDYRTRTDVAEGLDMDYHTDHFGTGVLKTYYMNERNLGKNHIWEDRTTPTVERERFKVEWRHKWDIDDKTTAIWQYYKLSDSDFLKDYFEREYEEDSTPPTYFLATRQMDTATLSIQVDKRVNRFVDAVERLPEVNYNLPKIQIGETGFYFNDSTTVTNLDKVDANPTESRLKTIRVDTVNELAYPFKVSFLELRPFVGTRHTYYSRTPDQDQFGTVRAIFDTGSDVSTKFFRIYDVKTNVLNLNIDRLRHVVTPSVAYLYTHDPSISRSRLDRYDSVDALTGNHGMNFSLENKLQTKRGDKSVDLARFILGSDFRLKEDDNPGGFNNVTADIDLLPYPWMSFYLDSLYDSIAEHLQNVNFDFSFHDQEKKWYWQFGKRYEHDVDDQITTELGLTINPKWKFRTYHRFDTDSGRYKEYEIAFRRDLHCWMVDISFGHRREEGDEIWVIWTLKDFPDLGFDFSTGFNRRNPGSQNLP